MSLKASVEPLIERISQVMKVNIPMNELDKTLSEFYNKGLEEMEMKFKLNFTKDPERFNLLKNYVAENIKGLNKDMQNKVRQVITRGIMNLESGFRIQQDLQPIINESKNRVRAIVRTETNRALNIAHADAAKQLETEYGIKVKKQWLATVDSRTSKVCRDLNNTIVPRNKKFKWTSPKGQHYEFDEPPAHVNCRSRVIYIQED